MMSMKEAAIEKAKASDRAAKYVLMKKLEKTGEHKNVTIVAAKLEDMNEKRYRAMKSGILSRSIITSAC